MEIIYSDLEVECNVLRKCICTLFPSLVLFEHDYMSDPPVEFDSSNPNHILFYCGHDPEKMEFGYYLEITRTSSEDSQEREIHIIRELLPLVNTRFLISYVHPNQPESPYFCLIFDKDGVFLADDFDTNFFDGSKGLVRKLEKLDLPIYKFDSFGRKIG